MIAKIIAGLIAASCITLAPVAQATPIQQSGHCHSPFGCHRHH